MTDDKSTPPGCTWITRQDGSRFLCINDEIAVKPYSLPDPLIFADGREVIDALDWHYRRDQLLKDFEKLMYGKIPVLPYDLTFTEEEPWTLALDGLGMRKQEAITIQTSRGALTFHLLLYAPAQGSSPYPAFLGLNFSGNHSIHNDPQILLPNNPWMAQETFPARGSGASHWDVEKILQAGFALGTIFYGDIDPDFDDGFQNGLHPLFYQEGQTQPKPQEWGSIAAWSFGLSRALDFLETDPMINAHQVAVIGHSRLGKTAVWAGVKDERFAMVISNNSGCGGAALSKRAFGETVEIINHSFPHWFCEDFKQYNGCESILPFDQHQLLALIAPRPLYVASAVEDWWSDPCGEFLGARGASGVYEFLGKVGIPMRSFPALDQTDHSGSIAYHIRSGGHDVTSWDWEQYLTFFRKHLQS